MDAATQDRLRAYQKQIDHANANGYTLNPPPGRSGDAQVIGRLPDGKLITASGVVTDPMSHIPDAPHVRMAPRGGNDGIGLAAENARMGIHGPGVGDVTTIGTDPLADGLQYFGMNVLGAPNQPVYPGERG